MRLSFISISLASAAGVIAGPLSPPMSPRADVAPALPQSAFTAHKMVPLSLDDAKNKVLVPPGSTKVFSSEGSFSIKAVCSNPTMRREWHSTALTDAQRKNFVDSVKRLMGRPSQRGGPAKNRYDDLVLLHQQFTPTVHGNRIFLLWHRYFLWVFEDILRKEAGLTAPLPWFDETKFAGRYSQSSIFSSTYFGAVAVQGNCVTNGVFANTVLNIGPGSSNVRHCLSRNGNADLTKNTNTAMVNACQNRDGFANMAACAETGAHAWGHNGIGAVMADAAASPGDPVFWLHHAFIDRNFRVWQNQKASRISQVDGNDANGRPITLDTVIDMRGVRPNLRVRDILNTFDTNLCYRYDY